MMIDTFKSKELAFVKMLESREMSESTIRKYRLALRTFIHFAEITEHCNDICKDCLIQYKNYLQNKYKPATTNLYIAALNKYLVFIDAKELGIKALRIQEQNVMENCFTIDEYKKMLEVAKRQKNNMIYYIMRTLANTGMRIIGLTYITVSSIKKGSFIVMNKGKMRCIVIPYGVCRELHEYCIERDIKEGFVFRGQKPDTTISQNTVRRWLKKVATEAGIDENKAFPHNLRHLFAMTFLDKYGNLSELSDILGHTRIETTRIYTRTGIEEKRKKIEEIGL